MRSDPRTDGDDRRLPLVRRLRSSYVARFVLALLVVLAVITSVGVVAIRTTQDTLETNVNEQVLTQTRAETEQLSEFVGRFRQPTLVAAADDVFATDNRTRVQAFLTARERRLSNSVVALHVVTVDGNRVVATTAEGVDPGTNVSDLPWTGTMSFDDGLDDAIISEPYRGAGGRTVVAFVSPVNREPTKVLVLTVDAENVGGTFATPIEGSFTEVVAADGTVLFSSQAGRAAGPYLERTEGQSLAIRRAQTGRSGLLQNSRKETERPGEWLVGYAPVEGTDWVLVKHVPLANAYSVRRNVTVGIALFLLVAVLSVLGLGLSVGHDTVRSVTRLADKARRIESGDYEVELSSDRADELGQLYDAVDGMRDTLVSRIEEARTASERLATTNETLKNQRLVVSLLNRVLRHNLRNDIHVVQAHGEIVRERSDRFGSNGDKIVEHALALVERTERAGHIEEIVRKGQDAHRASDVANVVRTAVADARNTWPAADIAVEIPEGPTVIEAHEDIAAAVEALIENAVEHNDGDTPTVSVTVATTDDAVTVTVADDGPGIPEAEAERLESDPEAGLRRRTGFGLWLANWLVTASDGTLDIRTDECEGTRVTLVLPRDDGDASQSG